MKILKLNLRAFGSFSDFDLDLSQGNCGVHIIYGPNEAGKSTALRALEQLLFGIPGNSADNFIHPYPRLRIGASLNRSDGKTLHFLRRKGTKNTLLQPDDKTPLDDAVLERFLGGLDHRVFTTMFGIDHGRLEQGGRMLATGDGSVGAALFAAATGLSNYRTVCEGLEAESKKLFAPRASKATINANLTALKDARKKIREAQLPSSQWMEHEDALRHADDRLKQLDAELQEASRQRSRLERLRQALPLAVKRKALLAQQASLGDVAILPADFAGQRREAVATLAITHKTEKEADEAIQQLNQKIEQLVVPETLLAESEAIESLRDRLGAHRKAQRDREALHVQKKQFQDNAASLLSRLRPDLSLDAVDGLRLTSQQKVGIVNQGNRHGALVKQLEQAETDIERLQVELDRVNDALTNLEPARDTRLLHDAVRRAQSQGDLDTQATNALGDLERLQNQVAVELAAAPTLDRIARPVGATRRAERRNGRHTSTINWRRSPASPRPSIEIRRPPRVSWPSACENRRNCNSRARCPPKPIWPPRAAAAISAGNSCCSRGKPASRSRLGWSRSWPKSAMGAIWRRRMPAAVQAADEIADRLRREAHRVAQQAALESERNKLEQHLDDLQNRLEQADSQRQHAWQSWVQCWQPLGIEPRWPREMRAWLQQQRALIARAEAIRNAQNAVDQLHNRIKAHRDELEQRLAELGEPWTGEDDWLAPRLGRAQTLLEHAAAVADTRATLENDRQRLSRQLDDTRQSARQANDRLAEWQQQWAIAIEPLGLPPATTPDVANEFVARLDDLFERLDEAKDQARFESIEIAHDADQFRDDVSAIARRIDPDLPPLELEPQVEELVRRLRAATADSQSRKSLVEQRSHQESVRETARNTIGEMTCPARLHVPGSPLQRSGATARGDQGLRGRHSPARPPPARRGAVDAALRRRHPGNPPGRSRGDRCRLFAGRHGGASRTDRGDGDRT